MKRASAVVLSALVAVGLMLAPPASAATGHMEHLAAALHDLTLHDWYRGKVTAVHIKSWERWDRRKYGTEWVPTVVVTRPCYPPACTLAHPPVGAAGEGITITYDATTHTERATMRYTPRFMCRHFGHCPGQYHNSAAAMALRRSGCGTWWQPWTWCWSRIMGDFYNNVVAPCWKGALSFSGAKVTEKLAQKVIADGATLGRMAGPDGWAVSLVGGCAFGIVFSRATSSPPALVHQVTEGRLS